ncbi:MAG: glycosyltransferase family 4 protein [Bacillota bacterium]
MEKLNILMFSWEYPPISHGGLARHVKDLSEALVEKGHSLYVITQGDDSIPKQENVNGVNVIRTNRVRISPNNFIDEILQLNYQLVEEAIKLKQTIGNIDLVHGHDWLVFWAAKVFKHSWQKPLVYTIHATESGRNQGIYNDMQRYINDIEWYAGFEAWKVIVCSDYMKEEVQGLFQIPEDKIAVIKNGVNPANFQADYSEEFRSKYATPQEDIIFYIGRIVREKGIQVLIQALPKILEDNPSTKLVIAGKGNFLEELKSQAQYLGIADRIFFTGFVSDEERNKLYQVSDVAVFPSLYEPFGIVALESMAAGTPTVVSDIGGMGEFIKDGVNGIKVEPNNPFQLAEAVKYILNDEQKAQKIIDRGLEIVEEEYDWAGIAAKTLQVYREVINDYQATEWNKDISPAYIDNEQVKTNYKYI